MNVTAKSLGIDKLNVADQIELIGDIWDGISREIESRPLSDELKAELDRRIEEADANPDSGVLWDDARREALDRLKN